MSDKGPAIAAVKERLREQGMRYTSQRESILKSVLDGTGHFHAEEAFLQLRAKGVSRATIYRMLPILVDCGILERAFRRNGRQCYERVYARTHHDHLLCLGCGAAIEFCDDRIEKIQSAICKTRRFKSLNHQLIIRGVCATCAKRAQNHRRKT